MRFRIGLALASLLVLAVLASFVLRPGDRPSAVAENSDKHPVVREMWDVYLMHGAKVGYGHTEVRHARDGDREMVRTTSSNRLTLKRHGRIIEQMLKISTDETLDGQLVSFESQMTSGLAPTSTKGRYVDGRLLIEMSTEGATRSYETPWKPSWGGFFATEQSLRRQPMRPGEVRTLRCLIPVLTQSADILLEAMQYETAELLVGSKTLLRITSTVDLGDGHKIETIFWTDRSGRTLKSLVPSIGQEAYRTTQKIALSQAQTSDFDLGEQTTVRVSRRLDHAHQTSRITYHVRLDGRNPSSVFAEGVSQSVTSLGPDSARIVVRAVRPEVPDQLNQAVGTGSGPEDLEPNHLIQSDDERIETMARAVATDESDPWTVACALERYVRRSIRQKNFSQAFATAAEVARTLEGDCTEHAVLLAALCRVRDIPARVAMGLVYYPADQGYAYHMWNEVWIRDRWVPLDATIGQGGIGGAHLKLADSSLKGFTAYRAFLPVLQVLGRLEIEIEQVR